MGNIDIRNFYLWPLTTRLLIMGLLCVVVFYGAYTWDITDLKSNLQTEKVKEKELKQQIELIVQKEITVNKSLANYNPLISLLKTWQKQIINYGEMPELLNTILKIGANDRIYFTQFNPGIESQENNYIKVPIHLIAVGTYHQLADFMSQVANLPFIIAIGNFSISRDLRNDEVGSKLAALANSQNLLSADINFNIYRMPKVGELKVEPKVLPTDDKAKGKIKIKVKKDSIKQPAKGN